MHLRNIFLGFLFVVALSGARNGEKIKELNAVSKGSYIEFRVPYFEVYNLLGRFKSFSVSMQYSKDDLSDAEINATLKVRSIVLPEAKLEKEFVKEYLFDCTRYPEASFNSTKVNRAADGRLTINGMLSIKGIERKMQFTGWDKGVLYDTKGGGGREMQIAGKLSRFDFGIDDVTKMHGDLSYVVGDSVEIRGYFLMN